MPRPSAQEFLLIVLESLEDLPPGLAQRLTEVLASTDTDRSQAIRQVLEELAGE